MTYRQRLLTVFITSAVLIGSLLSGTASAASFTSFKNISNDPILCGLWSGSNFELTFSDQCDIAENNNRQQTNTSSQNETVVVPTPTNNSGIYAAVGDSVAAGLGLPLGANTTTSDIRCGRSPQAYPNRVARQTNMQLINASCSGATAGDLVTRQAVSGPNITAQLDTAFSRGTPEMITITAGANDAHWADFIRACYAYDCSSSGYSYVAQTYLSLLRFKLDYALASISNRSDSAPPQVFITGYYNPLSLACAQQQQAISSQEIAWLTNEMNGLNQVIQDVSQNYSFVRYVDIDFTGHGICSTSPWVQGINDAAPFHPTARGQQVIADTILSAM